MDEIFTWLLNNRDWLFSGAGIVIIAWIIRLFINKEKNYPATQNIRSGINSKNVQAGRDVFIGGEKKSGDVE